MNDKGRLFTLLLGAVVGSSVLAAVNPAKTEHRIGDCFGGGVIFYVNKMPNAPVGQRGLIASGVDLASSFAWDTNPAGGDVPRTQATLFSGSVNSELIMHRIGSARAQAVSAARHGAAGTNHDWYLPAQQELSTLYARAHAGGSKFWTKCGGSVPSHATYWSSTQESVTNAWGVSFAGGGFVVAHKNSPFLVRPIRAF